MRNSYYDRRKAAKTDLFNLIEINKVSANFNQPELSETNKKGKDLLVKIENSF